MKNLKGFNVKYMGATNTKGARVIITDNLTNKKVTVSWDYRYSNTLQVATNFLTEKGLEIVAFTEDKDSYTILTEDFNYTLTK